MGISKLISRLRPHRKNQAQTQEGKAGSKSDADPSSSASRKPKDDKAKGRAGGNPRK